MAQPLPAGWEARFDAGSGRYYFINHYNKQTTWVDPRGAVQQSDPRGYPQQQQSSYQQQQAAYAQQQQQQRAEAERKAEAERQAEAARQQAEAARRQAEAAQREAEASRSYTESIQLQDRSTTPTYSSHSQETEISRGGGSRSALGDSSDMVSDSEKQQMSNQLKNLLDLEGVADDLILMTLDGVMYNVDMAVQVFQSMGFKKKGESGAAASSTSEDRWETATPPRKQKEKEKKEKEKKKKKTKTTTSQPIPSLPEISSQPIPTLSDTTFGQGITFDELDSKFKPGGSTLFDSLTPDQGSDILSKMTSAADVSVRSMFSDSSATVGKVKATPTPSVSTYTVQDKVGSVGADRGLARGSDRTLLSNVHIVCQGADAKLSVGPQKKLANGANRHLANGANRDLCVGRNPTLAKGPQRGL